MSFSQLLLFAGIYAVAVATPGPGIAALVARVLRQGLSGLGAMIAGFVLGDLSWFIVAAAGLAVIAQTYAWVFMAIKFSGAAYLIYLAWKSWNAPVVPVDAQVAEQNARPLSLFLSTLSLTLGNPKVIIFFLSIMPLVVDVAQLNIEVFLSLGATIVVVMIAVLSGYAVLAQQARQLFRSVKALKWLNRGVAGVLAGAGTMIAAR